MRIAIYSIAKNEASFVERWYSSAKEADSLHILDTGSVDKTVTIARDLGIDVLQRSFDPWRFDVARNVSLGMVPTDMDYCIALDMDEVLVPGWRDELERMLSLKITRPRYKYTWSWNDDGSPGLQYGGDKIHARAGYRWKHPVHEVLVSDGTEIQGWCDLQIHHHPDPTKSRSSYFPLLQLAVEEDPADDRNSHYLAREYFFNNMFAEAEQEFKRHLSLPSAVWAPERAQSYRYLYKITKDPSYLIRATSEAPDRREAHVELAQMYHDNSMWWECLHSAMQAINIKERPLEYLTEGFAWGSLPYDLAAIACYRLGLYDQSYRFGVDALELDPSNSRLTDNVRFYERAAS